MVMRECNSQGPLTETLTGVIGINNVLCLLAFSLVAAGLQLTGGLVDPSDWIAVLRDISIGVADRWITRVGLPSWCAAGPLVETRSGEG